jgi:hypothetical protein
MEGAGIGAGVGFGVEAGANAGVGRAAVAFTVGGRCGDRSRVLEPPRSVLKMLLLLSQAVRHFA